MPETWRGRFAAWRNRLLLSRGFQRLALALPPLRGRARSEARALFDLGAGFIYAQTLSACVELHVFELLADGGRPGTPLAADVGLSPRAGWTLFRAAAALRLLEIEGEEVRLGMLGAALLGNAGVREMVRHHAILYRDLADPVALLRRPRGEAGLAAYWAYAGVEAPEAAAPEAVAAYSALMAASQPMVAEQVLDAYPVGRHRRLLDVGGGEGAFLAAAAARAPRLQLMLFDLPAVTERAKARLGAAGLGERLSLYPGSFFKDALPGGADLVSLIRILHDHDDDAALAILQAARAALPPDGALLIGEPMAGAPGAHSVEAYFCLYLLAMGRGRPRTPAEIAGLCRAAGFRRVRSIPTRLPLAAGVILARP